MPVLRSIGSASLCCALLLVGCPGSTPQCPEATVITDPAEIPSGRSETDVFVEVSNPTPENGLEVITELTAVSGAIADPFALATTFACVHDESGEVEICVNVTYAGGDGGPEGGVPEAGVSLLPQSEDPTPFNVRATISFPRTRPTSATAPVTSRSASTLPMAHASRRHATTSRALRTCPPLRPP